MSEPDDMSDERLAAANRADRRRATIITVLALIAVLVASLLIVIGGVVS